MLDGYDRGRLERSYRGRILKPLETVKTLKVIQSPSTRGCVDICRTTHILAAAARVRRRLLVTHTLLPSASEVEIIIVSPSSHPFLTLRMLPFSLHPLSRSFETTAASTPCSPISLSQQPWTLPLRTISPPRSYPRSPSPPRLLRPACYPLPQPCERKVSYVAVSFGLNKFKSTRCNVSFYTAAAPTFKTSKTESQRPRHMLLIQYGDYSGSAENMNRYTDAL